MTGVETFQTYMAVKLHFTQPKFDAFRFRFRCPMHAKAYRSRPSDQFVFESLGRKLKSLESGIEFFVLNHLCGNEYVRDMNESSISEKKQFISSFTYNTKRELMSLKELDSDFDSLVRYDEDSSSSKLLSSSDISLELKTGIDMLCGLPRKKMIQNDPFKMNQDLFLVIDKYKPFLKVWNIDLEKLRKNILEVFS